MNRDQDRTFRPRLEALEGRAVPSVFPVSFYSSLQPSASGARFSSTPAQVHTLVNPAHPATRSVSIVPHHISLGLYDKPSPITVTGFDPGLNVKGLPGPNVWTSDPGLSIPGLPHLTPSQPVGTQPLLSNALTLSPSGVLSGSFW